MNIGSEKINPSEAGSSRSQSHSQVSRSESLWSRVRAPAPVLNDFFCDVSPFTSLISYPSVHACIGDPRVDLTSLRVVCFITKEVHV
jgi:hypothetical protein